MAETTKGMFFNNTLDYIDKKKGSQLKDKISKKIGKPLKYISFKDYPVQEYIRIQEEAIKELYPGKTMEEGMYELGKVDFKTFADSVFGKVVTPRVRHNLKKVAPRMPSWYMKINKYGTVSVVDLGEKSFRIIFKEYKNYPQLHQGFLQQGMETLGYKGKVTLNIGKMEKLGPGDILADFECVLEWE